MESIDSRSQFSDPSMSQKTNKQKKSKIFFIISLFYRGNEAHTAVCVTYRRYGDIAIIAPSPIMHTTFNINPRDKMEIKNYLGQLVLAWDNWNHDSGQSWDKEEKS